MVDKSSESEKQQRTSEYEIIHLDQSPAFALRLDSDFHKTAEDLIKVINALRVKGLIVNSDSEGSELWGFIPSLSNELVAELQKYGICAIGLATPSSESFLVRKPNRNLPTVSGSQSVVNAFRGLSIQVKNQERTPKAWSVSEHQGVDIKGQKYLGQDVNEVDTLETSNWSEKSMQTRIENKIELFGPFDVLKIDINNFSGLARARNQEDRQKLIKDIALYFEVIVEELTARFESLVKNFPYARITQSARKYFLRGDQTADSIVLYFNPQQISHVIELLSELQLNSPKFALQAKHVVERQQVFLTGSEHQIIHSSKPISSERWAEAEKRLEENQRKPNG